MKLTKNQLRELKIYNEYNLATIGQGKCFIGYTPGESGRAAHYPYWVIVGIGFKTDSNGWWGNYGNKVFHVTCREEKASILNEAIQFCFEKYAIAKDQWEKDPFGGYQIKGTIQKAVNNQRALA